MGLEGLLFCLFPDQDEAGMSESKRTHGFDRCSDFLSNDASALLLSTPVHAVISSHLSIDMEDGIRLLL